MAFVLYRSSAGSGKTYTLVKEYLKLVLQHPEKFKHILAVTFTNKAAGEMKERILKALKTLAKEQDHHLALSLKQENPALKNIHIHRAASQLLTKLLHNYSDFAIMTIDSFIHRVIKAFALEMGLPLNFSIDLNYEKIENHVVEKLLDRVGKDPHITDIILEFVFARVKQEKSWRIEGDIREFEKELFNEKNIDWVRSLSHMNVADFKDFMAQLDALRLQYVRELNRLGKEALDMIRNAGLTVDDFAYKDKGPAGFLQKCTALKVGEEKRFEISTRFRKGQWLTKSAKKAQQSAVESLLASGLEGIADDIVRLHDTQAAAPLTASAMLDNIHLAAIINQVKALVEDYKKINNVVPISEFNVKVHDIVKNSPVPFIYSILGEKFNSYLIDEFQDTSRLQWENLFPLIEDSLGSGFFSMAVGDGKQSIYRWRGGDVEIMETNVKERIDPEQLDIKLLDKNYRSRDNIITFNNRFFTAVLEQYDGENDLVGTIYNDIAQGTVDNPGGRVTLQFIPKGRGTDDEDDDGRVFRRVLRLINDALAGGYNYADIAILVRENKKGRTTASKLLEEGIPVVSPDSLSLARVPLVQFLIDILTYLNNPDDKIAGAAIIYFLAPSLGTDHEHTPTDIGRAILENRQWELLPELKEFYERRNLLIRLSVYEVIEEVVRMFKLDRSLKFATPGYLQAFLDVVAGYTAENSVDFSSFLDWWELNKDQFSLPVPENKPAVKIMSIHKAKGLEFPVVIVPYADWEHRMDGRLWLQPEEPLPLDARLDIPLPVNTNKILKEMHFLERTHFKEGYREEDRKVLVDNINLLYVAFTRAVDALHIIAMPKAARETFKNFDLLNTHAVNIMQKVEKRVENTVENTVENEGHPVVEGEDHGEDHGEYYVYGDVVGPKGERGKGEEIEFHEERTLVSEPWHSRITIRRRAREFWRFDEGYRSERRAWGILMHQVLSRVHDAGDVGAAVDAALAAGDINADEKTQLTEKINDILDREMIRDWFVPGLTVMTEAPIITDDGELRPDRVIVTDDGVIVVDFKTGEPDPGHHSQMTGYKGAVLAMGYHRVRTFLLYLETGTVTEVE